MAAGLGYKEFSTGDVLTAADANGYLASQVVMVFADSTARTAAITSPQEGMISYLKDTNVTQYYSGSSWISIGGSASPLTTKGDLYTYSTADARLAVGTNGQVLIADSTAATGLKWGASTSGLTLVKQQTIGTGVSSVAVSSAFSSTYDNYRVEISFTSGNFTGDIYFRFGSVITGYYGNNIDMSPNSATVTGASINNADSIPLCLINQTNGGNVSMDIMSPNLAKRSSIHAAGVGFNTTGNSQRWTNAYENSNTQHTAFTVLVGNTLTGGEIRVYGYQNS